MKNIALIHYYASLILKKVMKLEEVPENISEDVKKYINGEKIIEPNNPSPKEEEKEYLLGAININPIDVELPKEFNISGTIYIKMPIRIEDIFTKEVLGDKPFPENVEFSLALYEKKYSGNSELNVSIDSDDSLMITGEEDYNFQVDEQFLRCDVIVKSLNYEPMRLVFNFIIV